MNTCAYGATGGYGQQAYKGECPSTIKAIDFLIEQYKTNYINTSTSYFVKKVDSTEGIDLITIGEISALGLIEQFNKGYING